MSPSSSTDREKLVGMLAVANMRYMVTVHNGGCSVTVNGRRDQRPGNAPVISFEFADDGNLSDIKVEQS